MSWVSRVGISCMEIIWLLELVLIGITQGALVMNKIIVVLLSLNLIGCYTTMTSVFSSYDLKLRDKVERQPDSLFEASPHIKLGDNILIKFNNVPGRAIKPTPQTCEQAMVNRIDVLAYSNAKYVLDLSRTKIRANGKIYGVRTYRLYHDQRDIEVKSKPLVSVGFMSAGFTEFKHTVNENFNESYLRYVEGRGIASGTILRFDNPFSCGENHYEMDLWFIHKDSGRQEKYTIYFFPWTSTLTPH